MGTKILAFAGSTRKGSFNKQLVAIAAEGARKAGAEVTLIDLANYPLPLFDEDLEATEGTPEKAKELKELMKSHDGFLIASPEHNSSPSAVLKNVIDWASRKADSEAPYAAFAGKTAALISASTGALGGMRGLVQLRVILGNLSMIVIPESKSIPSAHQVFVDGRIQDSKTEESVMAIGKRLAEVTSKLIE